MPAEWALFRKKVGTQMLRVESIEDVPEELLRGVSGDAEGFVVRTPTGEQRVAWGSWLALDANGEPYAIQADLHEATYEAALVVKLLPEDVGPTTKSRCCNVAMQAQATGIGQHSEYGEGIRVAVSCARCDKTYGPATFVFRVGEGTLTVVPP